MKPWPRKHRSWAFHDAVVFSGGGNAGAAQVGMARALFEAGVQPDLFIGCSVGALNATYLASDPSLAQVDRLEAIWRGISKATVFSGTRRSMATHLLRRDAHLFEADGLRALIRSTIQVQDLADTAVPVQVVTTDIGAGDSAWWSCGDPVEILTASACLPGVFPPVRIGSQLHVDGGVLCPVPLARALTLGAQRVWVLDVCGHKAPQLPERPTALDVLLTSFSLARRALHTVATPDPLPGQEVIALTADLPPRLDVRDFSRTGELIDLGWRSGRAALEDMLRAVS
jgi:NTE family protein